MFIFFIQVWPAKHGLFLISSSLQLSKSEQSSVHQQFNFSWRRTVPKLAICKSNNRSLGKLPILLDLCADPALQGNRSSLNDLLYLGLHPSMVIHYHLRSILSMNSISYIFYCSKSWTIRKARNAHETQL